jgi:UDP-hydrolysing UDP-N-acetyl-D-glucosamine 2-epimerase
MANRIAVLSSGRQDWGILRSTCTLLRDDSSFDLILMLGGMHCSQRFGLTMDHVRAEGFDDFVELDWIPHDLVPTAHEQASAATRMVGDVLVRLKPECLVLVGDRLETAAAALAATIARIPIVHIHGGEETEGAIDNALRHAITKQSHLHFVTHPDYARRVCDMGEDPRTVHLVGAPGLDNMNRSDLISRTELEDDLGLKLDSPLVIVTLHPVTLGGNPSEDVRSLIEAMDEVPATYIVTLPNSDPGNELVRGELLAAARVPGRIAVEALGELRYWSLLRFVDALLGNSSSAIIEGPAAGVPSVNVGDRQKGRIRADSVIDAAPKPKEIASALRNALSLDFRVQAKSCGSPFGNGHSGTKIVEVLRKWNPPDPPIKRFKPELRSSASVESGSSWTGNRL